LGSQLHGKNLASCGGLDLGPVGSSLMLCSHGLSSFRGDTEYALHDRSFTPPPSADQSGLYPETTMFPYTGSPGLDVLRISQPDFSEDPFTECTLSHRMRSS